MSFRVTYGWSNYQDFETREAADAFAETQGAIPTADPAQRRVSVLHLARRNGQWTKPATVIREIERPLAGHGETL